MYTILNILKKIFLFPLDLMYLTYDSWIIGFRYILTLFRKEKDQPCHFCRGEDYREENHPVRAVLKYQNMWLVRLVSPCIRVKQTGRKRVALCRREGGYTRATAGAPAMALFLTCFWLFGTFLGLRSLSSDPEQFWANFITFFNPSRTAGGDDDVEFLTRGDARHNPERAERYYNIGVREFEQGRFNDAQVNFRIAIQSDPMRADLHFYLARSLLAVGQLVQGENNIQRTLDLEEDHVEALLIQAELHERREERNQALEMAARALELEPDNVQALRMNAGLRAALGQREVVRELADRLYELDGQRPTTLAFLGRLEFNVFQDVDRARLLLNQALEGNPNLVDALLAMIPIHAMEEDIERVDQTLAQVLELQPDNLQARRLEAELLMSRFGLQVGLRAYERLLTRFAGDLGIRLRYAELLMQSGRLSEGKRVAQQLTASRVPAIERSSHWMLAQMYAQVRMLEEAADHAQRALDRTPGARNIQQFLGQVYLQSQKPADARRVLSRALVQHPGDIAILNLLTQSMVQLGEVNQALELLQSELDKNPEADAIRLRMVEIRMQSERWRESLADTRYLHEKYQERPELANNLAFLLARSGEDLEYALSLSEGLMEQYGENPIIMDTHAYVLAAMGKHDEAVPLLEAALGKAPANPTIRFHLGKSLQAVGRKAEARQHLEAVLIIDPDFAQAGEVRNILNTLQAEVSS